MIDITITATRRHRVLRQTLESFKRNLFKDYPVRIIINIDPIGPDIDQEYCFTVCEYVFPSTEIAIRMPPAAHFGRAFKWVWNQARTNYVFHLEDDWELVREIDLQKMLNILNCNKDLALLRLPQFNAGPATMKNWNLFYPWNGEFFECPEDLRITAGFCGHPSLIRGEFIRNTVLYIDTERNPEKQFHGGGPQKILDEVVKWRYGVFSRPEAPYAIRDLGRPWMAENGLQKKGPKAWFLEWESAQ